RAQEPVGAESRRSARSDALIAGPRAGRSALHELAKDFVAAVAAETPTPGGGSVSALAGALAAALGEMVCRLTLKKNSFIEHHSTVRQSLDFLASLRRRFLEAVDLDAASYDSVIAAHKLPKSNEAERDARAQAIEAASKKAAEVPLQTAELAAETASLLESLRPITIPLASSDLAVALAMAEAARSGAIENVHANLPSIHDPAWVEEIQVKVRKVAR